jgi:tRNA-dihydrouridine synthase
MDTFAYAAENCHIPLCYNGDLHCLCQIRSFSEAFPQIGAVMLGRGLIRDPGMLTPGGTTVEALEGFYNELLEEYLVAFGGSRNAMFRLKEHWGMLIHRFDGSEKLAKRLRKTTDLAEYRAITAEIFHTLPLKQV